MMNFLLAQTKLLKKIDAGLSVHGINYTEFTILYYLHESPGYMLKRLELAEKVGITASGVTRVLATMEKIKLVEKEKNSRDARLSLVKLSDAGVVIFNDSLKTFTHIADGLLSVLPSKKNDSFIECIDLLLTH